MTHIIAPHPKFPEQVDPPVIRVSEVISEISEPQSKESKKCFQKCLSCKLII